MAGLSLTGWACLLVVGQADLACTAELPRPPPQMVQLQPRPFDSRPADGPPTPAPRSSSGGTMVLPRVPYDRQLDTSRRYVPDRLQRRAPESQRVVPAPPPAGGDPARFFDPPAETALSCESLRRLAVRTGRLYWITRYNRCIGTD